MILSYNTPNDLVSSGDGFNHTETEADKNIGTLIQDEAKENLERIIDALCGRFDYYAPRMYRQKAKKAYLNQARCKKHTGKKFAKW